VTGPSPTTKLFISSNVYVISTTGAIKEKQKNSPRQAVMRMKSNVSLLYRRVPGTVTPNNAYPHAMCVVQDRIIRLPSQILYDTNFSRSFHSIAVLEHDGAYRLLVGLRCHLRLGHILILDVFAGSSLLNK